MPDRSQGEWPQPNPRRKPEIVGLTVLSADIEPLGD
jgi:hypothetical protein